MWLCKAYPEHDERALINIQGKFPAAKAIRREEAPATLSGGS